MKTIYTFEKLNKYEIPHGITTRQVGSFKKNGKFNFLVINKMLDLVNASCRKVVFADQVHGDRIAVCDFRSKQIIESVDGLLTKKADILLGITNADCLSVTMFDYKLKVIGICHAGYKGLLAGVVKSLSESFRNLDSNLSQIIVGLGPSIGVCCYDVPISRILKFRKTFPFLSDFYEVRSNKYFLNIRLVAKQLLLNYGFKDENIEDMNMCTKCNIKEFFSFRGDKKETIGQFATFAYLHE